MLSGLLGRKVGMTQIFAPNGSVMPVTVIEAGPCFVTQVRTAANDGYEAVQIGFGEKKASHETRPMLGHLGHTLPQTPRQRRKQQQENARARQEARRKATATTADATETEADQAEGAQAQPGRRGSRRRRGAAQALGPFQVLREVKVVGEQPQVGTVVKADLFAIGEQVDVIGATKGKGFAGVMKRHGFRGGPRTHGQSDRARRPGSIGPGTTPGRVYKGTRMAGRMGNERVTVKALEVVQADPERNLIVVLGSIPGPNGGIVLIRKGAAQLAYAARGAASGEQPA